MTMAAGMGQIDTWPPQNPVEITLYTDADAARRLRDRVAREIAAIIDGGGDGAQCEHLSPVFRWLNAIAEGLDTKEGKK